jgi:hypothetical protein
MGNELGFPPPKKTKLNKYHKTLKKALEMGVTSPENFSQKR